MQVDENFEDKLKEIDELVAKLGEPDLSLSKSVNLYKKGQNLLKEAKEMLENAKLEIEEFANA